MSKEIEYSGVEKTSSGKICVACFDLLFRLPEYRNKWIYSEVIIALIKKHITHIPKGTKINTSILNRAASIKWKDLGFENLLHPNHVGVYRHTQGGRKMYFITDKGTKPDSPHGNKWHNKWIDDVGDLQEAEGVEEPPSKKIRLTGMKLQQATTKIQATTRSRTSQRRLASLIETRREESNIISPGTHSNALSRESALREASASQELALVAADITMDFENMDVWNSEEGIQWFGIVEPSDNENDDIKAVIKTRIERLKVAYQTPGGYKTVIEDADSNHYYSENDIFQLTWSCRYVVKALEIALEKMGMPNNWTWEDCCKAAVKQINDFEGWTKKSLIGNYRTVQRWHLAFRKNNECFLNKHSSKKGSTVLPPLLDTYPEAKEAIIKFASDRLNHLKSEDVHQHVHDVILPELAEQRKEELVAKLS